MTAARRERLSLDDAQILRLESAPIKGHTGKVLVLAPDSEGRALSPARLRDRVAERISAFPRLSQRVEEPRLGLGPVDAIRAIRASGGLPSLAHFAEAPDHLGFLRELVDAGLGGLEVHYRAYDLETVRTLRAIAGELRLVMTGGSDYHGDREAYDEAHAELWFPSELEGQLREGLGTAAGSAV